MQHRGASGDWSGASVIRTSVPQSEHRYDRLTRRNSPGGGGAGTGRENPAIIFNPIRYTTYTNRRETRNGTTTPTPTYGTGEPDDGHRHVASRRECVNLENMDGAQVWFVGDDPEELGRTRDGITERLHRSWLLDEEIDELNLALTEALTNLLQHAQPRTKSEVQLLLDDQAVHLVITDDSPPFEVGDPADADRDGGYGLLLLHMLTDEVEVTPTDSGGSRLRLTKHRPSD